jgi:DNA-binding transcriptional MerR regulator
MRSYLYSTIMGSKFAQIAMEFAGSAKEGQQDQQETMTVDTDIQSALSVVTEVQPGPADQQEKKSASKRGRPSLKEIDINADLVQIPPDEILFQKQYYSIGEVSKWFRVNQSLIRYWETEFDILQPRKNRKGDRFFRPIDVKNLVLIHDLLRRRKFTLEGAKEYLKNSKKAEEKFAMIQSLEKIKSFFLELKASL